MAGCVSECVCDYFIPQYAWEIVNRQDESIVYREEGAMKSERNSHLYSSPTGAAVHQKKRGLSPPLQGFIFLAR